MEQKFEQPKQTYPPTSIFKKLLKVYFGAFYVCGAAILWYSIYWAWNDLVIGLIILIFSISLLPLLIYKIITHETFVESKLLRGILVAFLTWVFVGAVAIVLLGMLFTSVL